MSAPTQQQVRALRGPANNPRPWREVAAELGITSSYAVRIAHGYIDAPAPIDLDDPREFYPNLAAAMTDEMVATWRQTHCCMCGCGKELKRNVASNAATPRGAYPAFAKGHHNRLAARRQALADQRRRVMSEQGSMWGRNADGAMMDVGMLGDLVRNFAAAFQLTLDDLRLLSGVGHLHDIMGEARRNRVMPATAARIYLTVGEKLRPEMREALRAAEARAGRRLTPPQEVMDTATLLRRLYQEGPTEPLLKLGEELVARLDRPVVPGDELNGAFRRLALTVRAELDDLIALAHSA